MPEFDIENGKLLRWRGHDTEIVIPDGVRIIGEGAFMYRTKLKSVVLPEGLEEIEERAFMSCSSLREINFPRTLKSIGDRAFFWCSSLRRLILSENTVSIGEQCFYCCRGLEKAELPSVSPLDIGDDKLASLLCVSYAEKGSGAAVRDGYETYIRENRLKLFPAALESIPLLTLLCRGELVDRDSALSAVASDSVSPQCRAVLMEYLSKSGADEAELFSEFSLDF